MIEVSQTQASRKRLDSLVRDQFQVSWGKARDWIETGKVWVNGKRVLDMASEPATEPELKIELRMNAPKPKTGTRYRFGDHVVEEAVSPIGREKSRSREAIKV